MQNSVIIFLAVINLLIVGYVLYKAVQNNQKLKKYREAIKKGDIVYIKAEQYQSCRVVEMIDNKCVVSLIVPKEFIYPAHAEIVDDFD